MLRQLVAELQQKRMRWQLDLETLTLTIIVTVVAIAIVIVIVIVIAVVVVMAAVIVLSDRGQMKGHAFGKEPVFPYGLSLVPSPPKLPKPCRFPQQRNPQTALCWPSLRGEMLSKIILQRTRFHVMTTIMMTMTFRHLAGFWEFLVHRNKGQTIGKSTCFDNTASLHRRARQCTTHSYDMN